MKKWLIGILAFILTVSAAYYQRITGPTYPQKAQFNIQGKTISFQLPHSHETTSNCPVYIPLDGKTFTAKMFYRFYPTTLPFSEINFAKQGDSLVAELPLQPSAGKLLYYITIAENGKIFFSNENDPQIVRFKGAVPLYILIPHILLMFFSMFFAVFVALRIFAKMKYKPYLYTTVILLFFGGMILGPIVQQYAFGALWTGIPFGWDLTDNKTLIAFVFWLIALFTNISLRENKIWVILATVMTLVIFSIPHSMFGSQLDYETGKTVQGFISLFFNP
ncbi:MAG: hypothetical protein DRP35_08160 [Candidatus Zixiibacteriota bacterium]|nr:MAG: hypothetical protein DRP35_08160 [candidate division Zixibacteria bacterium]